MSFEKPSAASRKLGRVPSPKLAIERYELECGAVLLVSPRPGAPVTAAQFHIRGGHRLDLPERDGTAWLSGRLVDQGTQRWSEEEMAALLEPTGGSVQGDAGGLSGSIASSQSARGGWRLLLDVMAELVTRPTFPKARVEHHKGRLLDRLRVLADDPRSQAWQRFQRLVYGDHFLGRPTEGTLESVPRLTRRHLVEHHKKSWVAKRAVIAVCGDVDPDKVRRFLAKRLADWRSGTPLGLPEEDFPERAPRVAAFPAERQQVHVFLGHLGVRRTDPDWPALVVMDHILGTGPGFSNRISRLLRDELGLAYSVSAQIHNSAGLLPGCFTAYIGTSPEHVGTAVEGFLGEIRRIREEQVRAQELELAQNYLVGSHALGFERASRRVGYMISAERMGLPEDHLARMPELFAGVQASDIQRAAHAHLYPESSCLVASGPVEESQLAPLVGAPVTGARRRRARRR